jgi:hypothetical protein
MRKSKKKTTLTAVFLYLLLSGGSWMFINSYANSHNQMSEEKMIPVGVAISGDKASLELLDHYGEFSLSGIAPESKNYCAAYLASPDEIKAAAYIISLCIKL